MVTPSTDPAMQMPDDLSRCLVLNTIAAARTLLRRYDEHLKPFGVTVQQFSLLAAIRWCPGVPVMTLAQYVMMDRTSLTRNLDLLERKGFARRVAGRAGNVRLCELTEQGNATLDRLMPEWQRIGGAFNDAIPEQDADIYRRTIRRLTQE